MRRRLMNIEHNNKNNKYLEDYSEITESGRYIVKNTMRFRFFLVGGGGGGAGSWSSGNSSNGGSGGRTLTSSYITLNAGSIVNITIGQGGAGGVYQSLGSNGGDTIVETPFGSYIAYGGAGGYFSWGGNSNTNGRTPSGGSGGGVGRWAPWQGGSNGTSVVSAATDSSHQYTNTGQGYTTSAWNTGNGPFYGAGGGAGGYSSSQWGTGGATGGGDGGHGSGPGGNATFYGGGGGGGNFFCNNKSGGNGYQGIVLVQKG